MYTCISFRGKNLLGGFQTHSKGKRHVPPSVSQFSKWFEIGIVGTKYPSWQIVHKNENETVLLTSGTVLEKKPKLRATENMHNMHNMQHGLSIVSGHPNRIFVHATLKLYLRLFIQRHRRVSANGPAPSVLPSMALLAFRRLLLWKNSHKKGNMSRISQSPSERWQIDIRNQFL
jgi:hypothetical protein